MTLFPFLKSDEKFSDSKPIFQTTICIFWKAGLLTSFKTRKNKIFAKFSTLKRFRFEDTEVFISLEINTPEKFQEFWERGRW